MFPLVKFWKIVKNLDITHKLQRFLLSIALLFKTTYVFADLIDIRFGSKLSIVTLFGFIFIELPSHIISTVYSLFLLSWLTTVADYLPSTYSHITNTFTKVIFGYNVILYILSFGYLITYEAIGDCVFADILVIGSLIMRDFGLALIFLGFLYLIRKIIGSDNYQDTTKEENSLSSLTIILTVILTVRGIIETLQSFVFNTNSSADNCRLSFYFLFLVFEIILESVPLAFLSTKNLKFCKELYSAVPLSEAPLLTDDDIRGF